MSKKFPREIVIDDIISIIITCCGSILIVIGKALIYYAKGMSNELMSL